MDPQLMRHSQILALPLLNGARAARSRSPWVIIRSWRREKNKGQPSSTCTSCSERKSKAQQEKYRLEKVAKDTDPDILPLPDFLLALEGLAGCLDLDSEVDLSSLYQEERDEKHVVLSLAKLIWDVTGYRWLYHDKHSFLKTESTQYRFSCAQSSSQVKKPQKTMVSEDKQRDKESMMSFHCHGWLFVTILVGSPTASIHLSHRLDHINYCSIDIPTTVEEFIQRNVAMNPTQLWQAIIDEYPTASFTKKAIYQMWSQADNKNWKRHENEHWGGRIRELALDSTWNTNSSRYELFATLGETYGSGLPLGYLLVQTNNSERGAKEDVLQQFLEHLKTTWRLRIIITLSDKDWNFVPVAQHTAGQSQVAKYSPMMTALPQLRFRINGEPQPVIPSTYRLTVHIPKRAIADDKLADIEVKYTSDKGPESDECTVTEESMAGDIRSQVNHPDEDVEDVEDAPDWLFDDGEKKSPDQSYVFCPAPHRKALLHLFTKHFCQHPTFIERDGRAHSPQQIRRDAVYEMYQFCKVRGLSEVWGYMWTSWYSPKRWPLWARSTTPYVSRARTTMSAENHFKQIKHLYLPHLLRPRLDQLVWILCTKIVPAYMKRALELEDTYRMGRSKRLLPFQTKFKQAWRMLRKKTIGQSGVQYLTNGSQPVSAAGSITDGDDHLWLGDKALLANGGWREMQDVDVVLGKRRRLSALADIEQSPGGANLISNTTALGSKVDVTSVCADASEDDKDQIQELLGEAEKTRAHLLEAAEIVRSQISHKNPLWLKNLISGPLAKQAQRFVDDVRCAEATGRRRVRTWPRNREDVHRSQNTMGYQSRRPSSEAALSEPPEADENTAVGWMLSPPP
ncbi:hypothetical protein WOLCODRAFT_146002 [Wolfiporia cocos MD-104 SS10]|uniref:Uncharacterized protein n=1 Tax=Wolfiporia cocos (strain MD-104) TaxID=742152 RepID=A0A2H3J0Y8_WOLCO|nr:hypothetical protein WOLCODRAFT_146002 [Wolfiporia cocos MD-104 SS10]